MSNIIHIARHTLQDQLQRRSLYGLMAVALLFVLTLRGCYDAHFTVNDQTINDLSVAWHMSLIGFHVISAGMLVMAVLMTMRVLPEDYANGAMILYLSRPVSRRQYMIGRLAGLWFLLTVFMLLLHGVLFVTAWQKTGGVLPGYLAASMLCSINLLFAVLLTAMFSLLLPGFVAAMAPLLVITVGFVSDNGYRILHSEMMQAIIRNSPDLHPAWWRVVYPKLAMLQHYAVTLVSREEFTPIGPVHPLVNVLAYCLLLFLLLMAVFDRKEV